MHLLFLKAPLSILSWSNIFKFPKFKEFLTIFNKSHFFSATAFIVTVLRDERPPSSGSAAGGRSPSLSLMVTSGDSVVGRCWSGDMSMDSRLDWGEIFRSTVLSGQELRQNVSSGPGRSGSLCGFTGDFCFGGAGAATAF